MPKFTRSFALLVMLVAPVLCGCQAAGSRFLSLIGLQKEPLAVALVMDSSPGEAVQVFNPFTRYAALQEALNGDLGRPVTVEPCLFFQAELGLNSGWYQLGIVSPAQFAQLSQRDTLRVLAVPMDREGRSVHRAVVVVPADSPIRHLTDLRGKVVAFGPVDDSLTHYAALQALQQVGLAKTDLALQGLPIPGSLKHFPDMRAITQSVMNRSSDAGFITETAWAVLPDHDDRPDEPARDKLRVVAETTALPDRLIVAAAKVDDDTAQKVHEALVSVGARHPNAVTPLDIAGYTAPPEAAIAACRALLIPEPAPRPAATEQAADTEPS